MGTAAWVAARSGPRTNPGDPCAGMHGERMRWELRGVPYPPIVLDRAANRPLYRQIEVSLRRSILDGRIGPGTVLPGIRAYAKHLGVAAVTVMTAYDQLTAEGYLEPRPGRGTVVAPDLPDIRHTLRAHASAGRPPPCPVDLADRPAPAVLRRRPPRAPVRLPDRRDAPRPVPGRAVGAPAPARVAGPRLRPGVRDDLPLPGGRSPAPCRARRLSRAVAGGPDLGRPGRRHGRRPERDGDRGAPVAGRRPDARGRGSGQPPPAADLRGVRDAARPHPGRRSRPPRRPACPTARPP